MKITRLSSIEVANASALPSERRLNHLLSIETPRVHWNYSPIEATLPALLNADTALFGSLPPGRDKLLLDDVKKRCKHGPQQEAACLSVAAAMVHWRNSEGVISRGVEINPLRLSVDTLRYCIDYAIVLKGRVYVVCADYRASLTLSPGGRELIKSLAFHTALIGDLRSATPALLRFPRVKGGARKAVFEPMEGDPLYSLDEVIERINHTYSVWETILRGRVGKASAER